MCVRQSAAELLSGIGRRRAGIGEQRGTRLQNGNCGEVLFLFSRLICVSDIQLRTSP